MSILCEPGIGMHWWRFPGLVPVDFMFLLRRDLLPLYYFKHSTHIYHLPCSSCFMLYSFLFVCQKAMVAVRVSGCHPGLTMQANRVAIKDAVFSSPSICRCVYIRFRGGSFLFNLAHSVNTPARGHLYRLSGRTDAPCSAVLLIAGD